jgi:glucose-1-phosphate thymidylyltransferase
MLPIAGRPILTYVVESLARNGIRKIVLVVGYRREQVFDYLGSGEQFGVEITYINQERQLGTAHALAQAKEVVAGEFLVLPGDNLIEPDTIARFVNVRPPAVLAKRVDNPLRYGVVITEGDQVRNIVEKPQEARSNLINTGIYAFTTAIFGFIEDRLDIPDVINDMLSRGQSITATETTGTWLDVVYPWDILSLNSAILRQFKARSGGTIETGVSLKGPVLVGKDTVIRSNSYIVGPVVIGNNCDIGPNVCILPATSIGDNVAISPFSEVKGSVISNDVNIGPGCIIEDSVIDNGCVIRGHVIAGSGEADIEINEEHHRVNIGAMLGESCNLGNGVVIQPGTIVGNYCRVQAFKMISGKLPDKALVF